MLQHIKVFFQQQPIANLAQIAKAVDVDLQMARCMLKHWIAKGYVRCLSEPTQGCKTGSCASCPAKRCGQSVTAELYCWQSPSTNK